MLNLANNSALSWQWECFRLVANNNVETDTGWDLPKYGEIDPWSMAVFVQTIDSTETLDVGLGEASPVEVGGDANGFLAGVSIGTAGWVRPGFTVTNGTNARPITPNTWGVLFYVGYDGTDDAACVNPAIPWVKPHIGDGVAKSITYTCSSGSDTFVGFLRFRWRHRPDLALFLK